MTDLGTTGRTYRINLVKGDEVMTALSQFAEKNHIKNAHFTGVGALSKGLFSWADTDRGNAMKKIELNQEAEVVSLVGSIARDAHGMVIVDGAALGAGDEVQLQFARGWARAGVRESGT